MKTRPLVILCWAQLIAASALVLIDFYSLVTRPAVGFEYSRATGVISNVMPDSPAARAGFRRGDRIVTFNGHAIGRDVVNLFFAEAGQRVPVVIERDGAMQTLDVIPDTVEQMRREAFGAGASRVLWAINGYLTFPLHLWMLGLAVTLLALRPASKDARLAALVFAFWAGGTFLFEAPGFGAIVASLPDFVRGAIYLIDVAFVAAFFAACLHFAIVFPSDRVRWRWVVLPYLLALPIFLETGAEALQRFRGDVTPPKVLLTEVYSTLGPLLLLASLVVLAVRLRGITDVNARRRIKLVFYALLPGTAAFTIATIVDRLELGYAWTQSARMLNTLGVFAGSAIFAYAVVRHRMFNVRVLVRRSLQYALAKGTLLAILSLPVLGLLAFLYAHRDDSLGSLITGEPLAYVFLVVPLALAIRYRKRLLEWLDRKFFREQYDARRLLLQVVSMIRGGSDMFALSRAALDEIDRALHPQHIALWQLDPEGEALRRGFFRGSAPADATALPATSTLALLLSNTDEPLDVHSRQTKVLLARLPEEDRDWLTRNDAHLLVPLLIERHVAGLLLLGMRKSEEPYSREDRELLRMLAGQLALTIDYSRLKQSPSLVWQPTPAPPVHLHMNDALRLCPACGRCYEADAVVCEIDRQTLVPESGVPRTIEEKYVITRLLGRGGMGAVYLATQKRLNRPVAIKVLLAHLVGSATMRSRFEREARIVARLRHPAIVTIHDFGVLPSGHAYLVMEYLDGQTLRKALSEDATRSNGRWRSSAPSARPSTRRIARGSYTAT